MAEKKKPAEAKGENGGEGGGNKKLFLILGAGGLVLAIAAGVGGWMLAGGGEKPAAEAEAAHAGPPPAIYAPLAEKLVVQIEEGGKLHSVMASISLMAHEQAVIDEVTVHSPLIRSRVVTVLGAQSFSALRTDAGREALRAAVLEAVQQVLKQETGKPGVEQVYFTDLVVQ